MIAIWDLGRKTKRDYSQRLLKEQTHQSRASFSLTLGLAILIIRASARNNRSEGLLLLKGQFAYICWDERAWFC
ncbi:MAG: hypothetical protein J2P21_25065, partial [Chloracidobacterium sp.]|nr:hypothetical protein [Chloracidobacterium sp.]